jgi:hypothetical protein
MLCREVVGRHVRLMRDVTTVGGRTFERGHCFKVSQTHRGKFSLDGGPSGMSRHALELAEDSGLRKAIESATAQALAQEWTDDPEGMPDERREALLMCVREAMQTCVERYAARLGTEKRAAVDLDGATIRLSQAFFRADVESMVYDVADALDFDPFGDDVRLLCEEAGYP